MDELREFQSAFHDGFAHSEPREHFFDSMVGQCSRGYKTRAEVGEKQAREQTGSNRLPGCWGNL